MRGLDPACPTNIHDADVRFEGPAPSPPSYLPSAQTMRWDGSCVWRESEGKIVASPATGVRGAATAGLGSASMGTGMGTGVFVRDLRDDDGGDDQGVPGEPPGSRTRPRFRGRSAVLATGFSRNPSAFSRGPRYQVQPVVVDIRFLFAYDPLTPPSSSLPRCRRHRRPTPRPLLRAGPLPERSHCSSSQTAPSFRTPLPVEPPRPR